MTPGRAPRAPFALLVTGLIAGGMALLLGLNTMSAANELHRHDIASRDATIAAQVQQLQIDVAASAAPDNLARAAEALGMVPAEDPAFLVINADGSVHVMGSAGPATAPPVPLPPKPKPKPKPKRTTPKTKTRSTTNKTEPKTTTSTTTPSPPQTVPLPGGTR